MIMRWRKLIGLALTTASLSSAFACRYNIRELGFVDVAQPSFRFIVYVHAEEQAAWLPTYQQSAAALLGNSNIVRDVIDEVQQPSAPEIRFRAELGPRLPGGVLIAPGREDVWPIYIHSEGVELNEKLASLVTSPGREALSNAVLESYGAVLLLRGANEAENQRVRTLCKAAIKRIEVTLSELPKRIGTGPQLIEIDPSLPAEQVIGWALGVNGRDLAAPVVAVVYGRGRLAGPAMQDLGLSEQAIADQLKIIGADCECIMDHSWMKAGAIPIRFSAEMEKRIPKALGFDPSAASVKAEVTQILANHTRLSKQPGASLTGGYQETPLEIIRTTPTESAPSNNSENVPTEVGRWNWLPWVLGVVSLAIAGGILWRGARR